VYWGVAAFEPINARRASQFVRWQFVPMLGVVDPALLAEASR
jgi:catalase